MKYFISTLFVLALAGYWSCSSPESLEKSPPNIIFILTDDQGWGDLSINGNTNISTPNIDKLATSGVRFDRFYVSPVCSPTRAEILTGRYHVRGGVYSTSAGGERLDLDEKLISEILKEAGYATAAYGKWHNGMQAPYHPNTRGFDDFYGFCSGHWGNYFSPMLEHNGELVTGDGFLVDDLTTHGLEFIEKNKDQPFFLYLPYNTPHAPMQVPDQWWDKYKDKELAMLYRDPEQEDTKFTAAALAMVENIDWNVGRVVKKLEALNLRESTLVIYLSDNGPNSWRWNDGMKGRKGSTDEGGVRSPLIMNWPGTLKEGKVVNQIASAIDFLPTFTALAKINYESEKPLDGKSLLPLLFEEDPDWEDRYIINHWGKRTSVRSQKYRLDSDDKLFDMENDPGQDTDISGENPEVLSQMIAYKGDWVKNVLSELPEEDTRSFTVGFEGFPNTQIPARDGIPHGNITRSNRHPNCTYFENWVSIEDSITWDVEVLNEGDYEVVIYYTCPQGSIGSKFELSFLGETVEGQITEAHDAPLMGMENDRIERWEGYVKDFKPLDIGKIHLRKGSGTLKFRALEIPGEQVMDFRLMMLKKT
ncbi:MAG: arylsulfatase [Bacteroidota bacterium]